LYITAKLQGKSFSHLSSHFNETESDETVNRSGAEGARTLRWNDARHNRELLMLFMSELAPVRHVATNTRKLT